MKTMYPLLLVVALLGNFALGAFQFGIPSTDSTQAAEEPHVAEESVVVEPEVVEPEAVTPETTKPTEKLVEPVPDVVGDAPKPTPALRLELLVISSSDVPPPPAVMDAIARFAIMIGAGHTWIYPDKCVAVVVLRSKLEAVKEVVGDDDAYRVLACPDCERERVKRTGEPPAVPILPAPVLPGPEPRPAVAGGY